MTWKQRIFHVCLLSAMALLVVGSMPGCGCSGISSEVEDPDGIESQVEVADDETDLPLRPIPFEDLGLDPDSPAAYYYQDVEVYSVWDATESENTLTEAEVFSSILERGFLDASITTLYDAGGEIHEEVEVDAESDEMHPSYIVYHVAENGDIWAIYVNDGQFMASPISYNITVAEVEVLLTEDGFLTSYDGDTDRFYAILPHAELCDVRSVDRIDATTLDALSAGELRADDSTVDEYEGWIEDAR